MNTMECRPGARPCVLAILALLVAWILPAAVHATAGYTVIPPMVPLRLSDTVERTRVVQPANELESTLTATPAAVFNVNYTGFTPEQQQAFQYALSLWSREISSPLPIEIDASWDDKDPGVLGGARPSTMHYGVPNALSSTFYPSALANKIAGTDLNGDMAEIIVSFANGYKDAFYYGLDGNTPDGKIDFVSVVMHEIGHGLGFTGTRGYTEDRQGYFGLGDAMYPTPYERFLVNGQGELLTGRTFLNPSLALGTQFTSNNLYYSGPQGVAANGGVRPKIYAPTTYEPGSSIAHLDETTYPAGNINSLMTPAIGRAEAIHVVGPITRGIFLDIGWDSVVSGPDAMIRTSTEQGYTGDNILNDLAAQTKAQDLLPEQTATYFVRIENENGTDTMTVTGTAESGGWTVRYYLIGAGGSLTDITEAVTTGTWETAPLTAGQYVDLRIDVSPDFTVLNQTVFTIDLTATSQNDATKSDTVVAKTKRTGDITGVTLQALPASPQVLGTAITLQAFPTGGMNPEYEFQVGKLIEGVTTWTTVRSYDTFPSYTWTPETPGTYHLRVYAREVGFSGAFQVTAEIPTYVIQTPPLTEITLTTSLASPQPALSTILATAHVTGGYHVEYFFRLGYLDDVVWRWTEVQAYSPTNTYSWTPSKPGRYSLAVYARENGDTELYAVYTSKVFIITAAELTCVSLAAGPVTPQPINTPVTLTATAIGGMNLLYRFQVGQLVDEAMVWTTLREYTAEATATWTSAQHGAYFLRVDTREADATEEDGTVFDIIEYTLQPQPLTGVTMTADHDTPAPVSQPITFTATAVGGINVRYAFEVGIPSTVDSSVDWTTMQPYSEENTFVWTPQIVQDYRVRVLVREAENTDAYQFAHTVSYVIETRPIANLVLRATPGTTQEAGHAVTLSASSQGGFSPEYWFRIGRQVGGNYQWETVQAYSTKSTYTWTPTIAGTYQIIAYVRESGSMAAYQLFTTLDYTVTQPAQLLSVQLTPSIASPGPARTAITLTANAIGGTSPEYMFRVGYTENGVWHWTVLQQYAARNTCTWTPTVARRYTLVAYAREAGSADAYGVYTTLAYTVRPVSISAVALTGSPSSPQPLGTSILLTAVPTNGVKPEYKFRVAFQQNGAWVWSVAQEYSGTNSYVWTPTAQGEYLLAVWAREEGSTAPYQVYGSIRYTIGAPAALRSVSLTADPQPTQPVGTSIALTTLPVGGMDLEYKFRAGYMENGAWVWTTIRTYGPATCTWTPMEARVYTLTVYAREKGSAAAYQAYATLRYTITTP